jgi:hypothetical protein
VLLGNRNGLNGLFAWVLRQVEGALGSLGAESHGIVDEGSGFC